MGDAQQQAFDFALRDFTQSCRLHNLFYGSHLRGIMILALTSLAGVFLIPEPIRPCQLFHGCALLFIGGIGLLTILTWWTHDTFIQGI